MRCILMYICVILCDPVCYIFILHSVFVRRFAGTSGEGKSVEAGSVELEEPLEVTLRSCSATWLDETHRTQSHPQSLKRSQAQKESKSVKKSQEAEAEETRTARTKQDLRHRENHGADPRWSRSFLGYCERPTLRLFMTLYDSLDLRQSFTCLGDMNVHCPAFASEQVGLHHWSLKPWLVRFRVFRLYRVFRLCRIFRLRVFRLCRLSPLGQIPGEWQNWQRRCLNHHESASFIINPWLMDLMATTKCQCDWPLRSLVQKTVQ